MTHELTRSIHLDEVVSDAGLVAAPDARAAEAGATALRAGGNAVDAAVAAAFAIAVLEPFMSSLGGGTWMICATMDPERYVVVEGGVPTPRAARPDMFVLVDNEVGGLYGWPRVVGDANFIGARSVGVPGTVAALCLAQERLGRLRRAQVLEPAIRLAADGFEVNAFFSAVIVQEAQRLRTDPGCSELFLPGGLPLRSRGQMPGDTLRQTALAATLETIARDGAEPFYHGAIGRSLVDTVRSAGGILSAEDIGEYQARVTETPLRGSYRGLSVLGPGRTGVPTTIEALQLFEAAGAPVDPGPRAVAWARAQRLAFRDRFSRMTSDPRVDVPWDELLSPAHARALLDSEVRGLQPVGRPERSGCTSQISAVDRSGNMVSLTQTVLDVFGARVLDPRTGVLLNDGMMWFDPRPGGINEIRPGVSGFTAVSPVILVGERGPMAALGAAGGRKLISCTAQVIANIADGSSMQAAIEAPRIHAELEGVTVDARHPSTVAEHLEDAGFAIQVVQEDLTDFYFGRPHGVLIDENGIRHGGADPVKPSGIAAE